MPAGILRTPGRMRCVCGGLGGFMVTWFDNKKEEEASPDDEALPLPGARGLPGQRGLEQQQFDDVDHSQHPVTPEEEVGPTPDTGSWSGSTTIVGDSPAVRTPDEIRRGWSPVPT